MNPFRQCLDALNLSNLDQGTRGWAYILLAALADAYDYAPSEWQYQCPFRECLRRLSPYVGHALPEIVALFSEAAV